MAQKKITANQVDVADIEAGLDIDNLVPAQTGNSGKVLGTDGTNVSWVDQTGGGGGGTWGSITGTLSAQTDLQTALDGKADEVDPSLSGTITLGDGTLIRGNFGNATDSPYFQSTSGNDTILRVRANGKSSTSVASVLLNGSNDNNNTVQVLLRARGDETATAASGVIWQKLTGGSLGTPPDFNFISHNGTGYTAVASISATGVISNDAHLVTSGHLQYNLGLSGFEGMLGSDTLEMHNLALEPKVAGKDNYDSSIWMFSNVDGDLDRHHLALACDTFTGGIQQAVISLKNAPYIGDANPSTIPLIIQNTGGGEIWVGEENSTIQMKGLPVEFHLVPQLNAGLDETDIVDNNQLVNKKYVDDAIVAAGGLPSQTGNSGKFLTTDGTNASWATVSGGAGALDDLTDVVITTPSNGQVLSYNGTNWVNAAASGGGGGTASVAEFDFPAAINGANNFLAAPSLFSSFVASWYARNSSNTAIQTGWNNATTVGSASAQSRTTNSFSEAGERLFRIRYSSATTANSGCGIHWGSVNHGIQQSHFLPYGDIFAFFRFNIFDERTDARHAVGWHRGILGANDPSTDPGTLPMIILGADAADTNMQIMHAASNASPTKINLGADFPKYGTHQAYEFAFYFPARAGYADTLHYYVKNLNNNEVATGTLTSNIPTSAPNSMNAIMAMRSTSSANMVSIEPSVVYLQTNVMG